MRIQSNKILVMLLAQAVFLLPSLAHSSVFEPWINGGAEDEPQMQVQQFDADTFVIRQSIKSNFEGPFLYLLFGTDRAILIDSGAGGLKVRPTIDKLISDWCASHGKQASPLVLAHSHSHRDHRQGDAEFTDRPGTVVVGLYPKDVADFFGISRWPTQIARFDLGHRVLRVIPTPGHEPAHIMIFDEKTHLLFSGDSLGPYRLYVPYDQFHVYRDSIDRVAAFVATHRVSWILGAHIEMTSEPGALIPNQAPSHPDEHLLEIPAASLVELSAALRAMGDSPVEQSHHDFVIFPVPTQFPLPPFAPPKTCTDYARACWDVAH